MFSGILSDHIVALSSAGPLDLIREPGGIYESKESARARVSFVQAAKQAIEKHSHLWKAGPEYPLNNLWRVLIADQTGRDGAEKLLEMGRGHEELKSDLKSDNFHHLLRYLEVMVDLEDGQDPDVAFVQSGWSEEEHIKFTMDGSFAAYAGALGHKCCTRCFALSESGRMCLVPPLTEPGDAIFIPFGAQVPYLIRKAAPSDTHNVYTLIGEAYVHGIMKGELLEAPYVKTSVLIE